MPTQSTFKTPLPILRQIENCRLKQEKRLDLRGGNDFGGYLLPIVPPELFTLTHLEELDLSHNALQVLPEDIKQLTHLKRIDLRDNPLRQVVDVFGLVLHYADFEKLKLSRENIVGLKLTLFSYDAPAGIFDFPNLTELEISHHRLRQLPEWVSKLTHLTSLDLSSNQIMSLKGLASLVNLISLNLSTNHITNLEELAPLVNLTSLYLSSNQIANLDGLAPLIKLTSLYLRNNYIENLDGLAPLVNLTYLYLSSNRITSLDGLAPLVNLSSLYLSSNQITNLDGLAPLVNLSSLYLSYNQITSLDGLAPLVNLTFLYLSYNHIVNLDGLAPLVKLAYLNLWDNQITSLDGLIPLVNLTSLDLSSNHITSLDGLAPLVNLTSLYLSSNHITNLDSLAPLVNLTSLYLRNNQITSLKGLAPLVNLTYLNLWDNQITSLEELAPLVKLTSLYLRNNQIATLDGLVPSVNLTSLDVSANQLNNLEGVAPLVNLTSLDVSANQLNNLEGVAPLVNLTSLDVSANHITNLTGLAPLFNLSSLNLSTNHIMNLDGLAPLANLSSLNLSANQIMSLGGLAPLVNLSFLDVSFNYITSLIGLSPLVNLTFLYLGNNHITNLEGLTSLANLSSLDLSANRITNLTELVPLDNLAFLHLGSNQIANLPAALFTLPKLERLNLDDNPITEAWIEELALEDGHVHLLRVRNYFRQLAEATDYLYEAKLLIVGEGGAGKTSLARKIQNPDYPLTQNRIDSTDGIDVIRWQFSCSADHLYRVNIWDFGGQEIYHATHQFFLTKRALYVLVADNRKEDTDFYYWLSVVELLSGNSPLLIVKNEKDDRLRDINETALKAQFDNLKEIYATNLLKNSKDFGRFLDDLQHLLKHLPHIGMALPKNWVDVRTSLENDPRNFISLQDFVSLCRQHGFKNQGDILQLSETLHDLGSILHFQQDPLLKKTVFLKPYWATQAVYHVLDNQLVKNNFGKFTKTDLEHIWYEPEYDFMHDELLQLMLSFKLCYPLTGCPDTFIAPQLLTVIQPQYVWDTTDNLVVFYKNYEFMPKGILTQLIVALHKDIADQQHRVWRSGVVLDRNGTQAKIIENYGKRELQIKVVGSHKRDMMTVIMHELQKIHDSYHKLLKYDVLLPCSCLEPAFFEYETLKEFAVDHAPIQCQKRGCRKMVDARDLIEGVLNIKEPENRIVEQPVQPSQVIVNVTAKSEAMSKEEHRTINISGNVTGSTLNLGEISGSVANTIQQLPDSPTLSGQPNLKILLTQLQNLIEKASDADIKPEDKGDALKQVQILAEVSQQPNEQEQAGLVRTAVRFFKGLIADLENAQQLGTEIAKTVTAVANALKNK